VPCPRGNLNCAVDWYFSQFLFVCKPTSLNRIGSFAASHLKISQVCAEGRSDELVQKNFALVSDRNALLKNCYEQVKSKMGAKTAARFVQVEHQLVMIIDLQIVSQLSVIK
jgi:hypothetical protein